MFSIEDRRRMVDRPITFGYRNDAMRIDTGGVSICQDRFIGPGDGLTLLEQDFESALAATPNGYGEGGCSPMVTLRQMRMKRAADM
ncbi:MAG: hypothetical protein WBL84_28900, partial [Xanthobacteraceae bacterium]